MNANWLLKFVMGVLVILVYTNPANAAFNAYLKIDGIDGESKDNGFEGWSDILGYNISATNSGSSSGGGGGAGKAILSDMTVKKVVDKSSPLLFGAVVTGKHYKDATIDVKRDTLEAQQVVQWKFEDVLVSSYSTSASTASLLDTLTLNYSKVTYSYYPQKADGSTGTPVMFSWDKKTNKTSITGNIEDLQFVTSLGSPIPEPSSVLILGISLIGIAMHGRRNASHL